MPVHESQMSLPGPVDRVFDFLARPANLERLSPPQVEMAFIDPPEIVALGTRLSFRIQAFGQMQQFEHEIIEFERPLLIREKAVVTPMKLWIQETRLEPGDSGLVLLQTRIEFEPPGGFLGYILTPERILSYLQETHEHRKEALEKALQ